MTPTATWTSSYRVLKTVPQKRTPSPAPFDISSARLTLLRALGTSLKTDPALVQAFWSEIGSPDRIAKPDVTVFYSLLHHPAGTFVLMEFVAGETIESLVTRSEPERVESAIPLFCQILDSFDTGHVSPDAPQAGRVENAESRDFGIVRAEGALDTKLFGTVVFRPDGSITGEVLGDGGGNRADVYPVLVAIYERLIGELPKGIAVEPAPVSDVVVAALSEEAKPTTRPIEEPRISLTELARLAAPPRKPATWLASLAISAATAAGILGAIYGVVQWMPR